jgi:hypothetical protein
MNRRSFQVGEVNQKNQKTVILINEIRDRVLGLGPLDVEAAKKENEDLMPDTGENDNPVPPKDPGAARDDRPDTRSRTGD